MPTAMRLKYIEQVDFRKSEYTNFQDLLKREKELDLKDNDVVAFVSNSRMQIVFVSRPTSIDGATKECEVISSRRLRISSGGTWNPTMLANYASMAGIELIGIKRFEDHYRHLTNGHS